MVRNGWVSGLLVPSEKTIMSSSDSRRGSCTPSTITRSRLILIRWAWKHPMWSTHSLYCRKRIPRTASPSGDPWSVNPISPSTISTLKVGSRSGHRSLLSSSLATGSTPPIFTSVVQVSRWMMRTTCVYETPRRAWSGNVSSGPSPIRSTDSTWLPSSVSSSSTRITQMTPSSPSSHPTTTRITTLLIAITTVGVRWETCVSCDY